MLPEDWYPSTRKRRKLRITARETQGYEKNPPRCASCERYRAPLHASLPGAVYVPPFCRLGNFVVVPHGICDRWLGQDGETLT